MPGKKVLHQVPAGSAVLSVCSQEGVEPSFFASSLSIVIVSPRPPKQLADSPSLLSISSQQLRCREDSRRYLLETIKMYNSSRTDPRKPFRARSTFLPSLILPSRRHSPSVLIVVSFRLGFWDLETVMWTFGRGKESGFKLQLEVKEGDRGFRNEEGDASRARLVSSSSFFLNSTDLVT